MAADARRAAVEALLRVNHGGGYSNIVLDNLLKSGALSAQDQVFATRLLYGVVERRLTIDFALEQCASMPLKRMHPAVLEILRLGVYQLLYMDRVPASAAVNEAVKLTRELQQAKASGFVNGVLRGVERKKDKLFASLPADDAGDAIRYSCPQPLIALWKRAYGADTARALLERINDPPETILRMNTLKITEEEFRRRLEEEGVSYRLDPDLPGCYRLPNGADGKRLAKIVKNCYYHQDTASQIDCLALEARPGERVADVCAAPGGKSFTLAQWMENRGALLAGDLYAAKCEGREARAAELGVEILQTVVRDASAPCPEPLAGAFDRVLCDVPCSGLGVIRRKPEIRYKPLEEVGDQRQMDGESPCLPAGAAIHDSGTLRPPGQAGRRAAVQHLYPESGGKRGGCATFPARTSGIPAAAASAGSLVRHGRPGTRRFYYVISAHT